MLLWFAARKKIICWLNDFFQVQTEFYRKYIFNLNLNNPYNHCKQHDIGSNNASNILEYDFGDVHHVDVSHFIPSKLRATNRVTAHTGHLASIAYYVLHWCDNTHVLQLIHGHHNVRILLRLRSTSSTCEIQRLKNSTTTLLRLITFFVWSRRSWAKQIKWFRVSLKMSSDTLAACPVCLFRVFSVHHWVLFRLLWIHRLASFTSITSSR